MLFYRQDGGRFKVRLWFQVGYAAGKLAAGSWKSRVGVCFAAIGQTQGRSSIYRLFLEFNEVTYKCCVLWSFSFNPCKSLRVCESSRSDSHHEDVCTLSLTVNTSWQKLATIMLNRNDFPRVHCGFIPKPYIWFMFMWCYEYFCICFPQRLSTQIKWFNGYNSLVLSGNEACCHPQQYPLSTRKTEI